MELNEYLDLILRILLEKHGINTWPDGLKFLNSIEKGDSTTALGLLQKSGYIDRTSGVGWSISLTPLGAHFIQNGGYTGQYKLQADTLKYAKRSYIVGLIAIVVTILIFIYQTCKK